ncbi:Lcl C-terminal domain-containing protein [Hydrogenophaga soli]
MFLFTRALLLLACCAAPLAHAAYTVNADGTVTDTTSGLVWDQCVLGSRTSAATSCAANTNSTYTWDEALAQVSARNSANHLGYSDWRLPNISELESLVDTTAATAPIINTTAFPNTPIMGDSMGGGAHWSSSSYAPNPADAWNVDFLNGVSGADLKTYPLFVRLVRSGQSFSAFDGMGTTSYTAPTPSGSSTSGNVTTTLSGGGAASCAMVSVAYQSANSVGAAPPAGVSFPAGVVNFTTTGCAVGGTVTVTLTYPSALPAGTRLYKYGPATAGASPSWYEHPATIGGNTITYSVTDNGVGDSNNTAGVITDPAGAGVPGGGAEGVAGVPTLSQWALLLLAGLVGVAAVRPRARFSLWPRR